MSGWPCFAFAGRARWFSQLMGIRGVYLLIYLGVYDFDLFFN